MGSLEKDDLSLDSKLSPEMGEGISQVKVGRVERWGDKFSLDVFRGPRQKRTCLVLTVLHR